MQVHPWLDLFALGLVAVLALTTLFGAPPKVVGTIALIAALAHLARLLEWQGWRAWRDPLVWVLHLGYAWIVIAQLLRGIAGHTNTIRSIASFSLSLGACGKASARSL